MFGLETRTWGSWLVLALLSAWLLLPALAPTQVEGFSASIAALGTHVANGSLTSFQASQPFVTEYFTLTKLGAVLGIAGTVGVIGGDGTSAFRLLMIGGLVLLLVSSAILIKRWAETLWLVACGTLVLMPGVFESGFFFNDNVPAAGLLAAAFAAFRPARSSGWSVVSGVLFGLAAATRIDLVILCAAVPLIALREQDTRRAVTSTAIVGAAAIATLFMCFAVLGTTPFDGLRVGGVAVALWQRHGTLQYQLALLLPFASVAGFVLLLFGAASVIRERNLLRTALLVGMPVFANLLLAGKIWEVRQFLQLTPFLGTLVAIGVGRLAEDWKSGRRSLPFAVGALALAGLFAPPTFIYLKDGPREMLGRVPGITLWQRWQDRNDAGIAAIGHVISTTAPGQTRALIADQWDEDRYAHLELVRQGYVAARVPAACRPVATVWQGGDRRVVHLTLQQSFVPYWEMIQADRLRSLARPCLASIAPSATLLLTTAARAEWIFGKDVAERATGAQVDPRLTALGYSPLVAIPLDAARLDRLETVFRTNAPVSTKVPTVAEGMASTVPRTHLLD